MSSKSTPPDPSAVSVRLSKDQVTLIWSGLNYIVCQNMNRELGRGSESSHSVLFDPQLPGADAGQFSARMMKRIKQIWIKINAIKRTGGKAWLNEFELRAAIFSARTGVDLVRNLIRTSLKKGAEAQRRLAGAKRALKSQALQKRRTVVFLEKVLKRATRQFKAVAGVAEFQAQSKEWQSHLRWMEYRLTYFKPVSQSRVTVRSFRKSWLATLINMVEDAIRREGFELPNSAELRRVLRLFLDYSVRGRMGEYDHIFMVHNQDSSKARSTLLEFVQQRLTLKKAR